MSAATLDDVKAPCRDVSQQHDIEVDFSHELLPKAIDPNVSVCLYRIAQEALHNVVRHSHAREASVRLTRDQDNLHLHISDSGIGFDARDGQQSGLGLVSMRERVGFLKGQLTINAAPGKGTQIGV